MYNKEPLTNDQKIELLKLSGGNEEQYKKMVDLIYNYDPDEKSKKEGP